MLELYVLLLLIIILLIIIYYQDIKKIEPIIEKFNEDQWLDSCPGGYRTYYLDNGDAACCDGEIIANKCLGNSQCRLTGIGTKEMPNCVTIMNDLYGRKGRLLCPPSMQNYFRDKSKNRTGCTSDRLNSSSTAPISSQSPKCIIYPDEETNQNKEDSCFNQKELENTPLDEAIKIIVEKRVNSICNLKYVYTDNINEADIRISFIESEGAWSLLGKDALNEPKTNPTMNLGWFDVPTTIHEFCHSLGMVHEHQNPNGEPIKWNENKVYQWALETQGWDRNTTYNNIIKQYDKDSINGSGFDLKSIMLYFFPGSLTLNNQGTQQNLSYSFDDINWINKTYPKDININEYFNSVFNNVNTKTQEEEQKPIIENTKTQEEEQKPIIENTKTQEEEQKHKNNNKYIILLLIIILIFFITLLILLKK
jgi:hypothetical protein